MFVCVVCWAFQSRLTLWAQCYFTIGVKLNQFGWLVFFQGSIIRAPRFFGKDSACPCDALHKSIPPLPSHRSTAWASIGRPPHNVRASREASVIRGWGIKMATLSPFHARATWHVSVLRQSDNTYDVKTQSVCPGTRRAGNIKKGKTVFVQHSWLLDTISKRTTGGRVYLCNCMKPT